MATGNVLTTVKIIRNRLIDASQATYVRGKKIEFTVAGLLPDTKLYAFTNSGKQLNSRVHLYRELVLANTISWTTADSPVTVTQSGFTANAVMILQNRIFIKDSDSTGSITVGGPLSLTKNLKTVNTKLLSVIPSSNTITTNDFGAAAGYIDIPDNYIPAGDVEIILSDAANGKGITYASSVYQASGIIEKYADITVTTNIADPDISGLPGEIRCGGAIDPRGIDFEPGQFTAAWDLFFDVYGYTPELYSSDETLETFTLKLPVSSKPGTQTDYEITGVNNSGSGYYEFVFGSTSKTFIKNISGTGLTNDSITIKVKRRDIIAGARTTIKMVVFDTSLTSNKAVSLTLADVKSTYLARSSPTLTCPASPPAPSFEPIFWLKGQEASFILTYGNSDGTVTGSLVMAASGDGSQTGFFYGVNPGGLFGRPATFTLEWIPISGWSGTYFIGAIDSYLLNPTSHTIARVNGDVSVSNSPEFRKYLNGFNEIFTFPAPYNAPATGPGGTKYVKKGKLRLTVTETGTYAPVAARTASVESDVITIYVVEPPPVVISPPVEVVTTPPPLPPPTQLAEIEYTIPPDTPLPESSYPNPSTTVTLEPVKAPEPPPPPTPALPEPEDESIGTEICGCVSPDTPILISKYESVRAGDLRTGDTIYTIQEYNMQPGFCKINYVEERIQKRYCFTLVDNSEITVSDSHVFLCDTNLWKTADSILPGERLITLNGAIEIKEKKAIETGPVILFTTEFGTYISQNIVSHNARRYLSYDDCGVWDDGYYSYWRGWWGINNWYRWHIYKR